MLVKMLPGKNETQAKCFKYPVYLNIFLKVIIDWKLFGRDDGGGGGGVCSGGRGNNSNQPIQAYCLLVTMTNYKKNCHSWCRTVINWRTTVAIQYNASIKYYVKNITNTRSLLSASTVKVEKHNSTILFPFLIGFSNFCLS